MVLDEVARAPGPERLLVGDGGEGEPAVEPVAQLVQVHEREDGRARPALHVGGASPPNLAVGDGAAPGTAVRPRLVVAGGKDVDVPVQHEVASRVSALEGADHVGKLGMGVDDPVRERAGVEKGGDVRDRLARVAGRVRALRLHELREEVDQHLAIGFDAIE